MSMFPLPPSEIKKKVIRCLGAGIVPLVRSSPGLGKSSIFQQIAKDFNLEYIDIRLSQAVPEDLMGLPMKDLERKVAEFIPFDMFPIATTPLPPDKNGWLLALDEFNSGTKSIQAAAYKLVLDRYAGMHKLNENVFVVAAGNLETDRAIVNPIGTAMKSRMAHYFMKPNLREWMDYAIKAEFDHRVLGFLEMMGESKLHHFNPDADDHTFPCPRTWEFVSKLIKDQPTEECDTPLIAGVIGDGTAVEFVTYIEEYDKLPSYTKLLTNGDTTPVPDNPSTRYALTTMMLDRFKPDDLDDLVTYINRIPQEFQVIFYRGVMTRFPDIRRQKNFSKYINHLVKFFSDTTLGTSAQAA